MVLAERILTSVTALLLWLGAAFLALMSVLVIGQVVARNAFDLGLPWADELARFSGIALVYLAVPVLALRGEHIAVDIAVGLVPAPARRVLFLLTEGAVIAFAVLTLLALKAFLDRAGHFTTSALGMPNTAFYAPAVASMALLAVVALLRAVTLISGPLPERAPPAGP